MAQRNTRAARLVRANLRSARQIVEQVEEVERAAREEARQSIPLEHVALPGGPTHLGRSSPSVYGGYVLECSGRYARKARPVEGSATCARCRRAVISLQSTPQGET